jgi:alpha-mannosidase
MKKYFLTALIFLSLTSASYAQVPSQVKDYTAHVVGHAHIDLAWGWRLEETINNILPNTFRKQLQLMQQYPYYTYAQDQAIVYELMERYYPDIFNGIVEKAKTRNWIPVSSAWTQFDENIPDGESIVRQFLYGQKYTKEKFGHYVRVAWQCDAFGHPFSMPQIARKAGIEFYLFGRPLNLQRPPIFWWQGLDGTRVLGYYWYQQPVDHEHMTVLGMRDAQEEGVKNILVVFANENYGGGADSQEVAAIAKLNASPDDVCLKPTDIDEFIDRLLTEKKDFRVWNEELNPTLEGCYTSQVDMKRNNRLAERLLLTAETMSELAVFNYYREGYPTGDLREAWKLALLNQTHDLLPGSGIRPIYVDAARQYQEIFERGHSALDLSLQCIGLQVDTRGEGIPVMVYNPQSWDRTDLVTVEVSAFSLPPSLVAIHGAETVPVQVFKPPAREGSRERVTVGFIAHKVPQMGFELYRLVPGASQRSAPRSTLVASTRPRLFLENEFLRVELNPATGNIARLYDKQAQREAFRGEGNFLMVLEESDDQARKATREYAGSAWNIGLTGTKWDVGNAEKIELIEHGPTRATVRVVHRFRDSEFVQDVSLLAGVPHVDVRMTTDWRERAAFLKAGFPLPQGGPTVAAEIPYGAIERAQTGKEMVMGKWVDISDANYGLAILNNGRHGFDAQDNLIRLSVIRGPWGPDPRADEGSHSFGYSIYPHRGGWREGKVELQALAFNSPLLALQEPIHAHLPLRWGPKQPVLPDEYSFVKTVSDHVLLYTLKQMEGFSNTDPILRFFEYEGREGDVSVQFPLKVRAVETNLLEETTAPIGEGKTIQFRMKPWEIKSIRITRAR